LEPIGFLERFGLGQIRLNRFVGLFGEGLEDMIPGRRSSLRRGHPVIGILDAVRVLVGNLAALHIVGARSSLVVLPG
jgi:hypothetical protein